jgi:hypothetical protein
MNPCRSPSSPGRPSTTIGAQICIVPAGGGPAKSFVICICLPGPGDQLPPPSRHGIVEVDEIANRVPGDVPDDGEKPRSETVGNAQARKILEGPEKRAAVVVTRPELCGQSARRRLGRCTAHRHDTGIVALGGGAIKFQIPVFRRQRAYSSSGSSGSVTYPCEKKRRV